MYRIQWHLYDEMYIFACMQKGEKGHAKIAIEFQSFPNIQTANVKCQNTRFDGIVFLSTYCIGNIVVCHMANSALNLQQFGALQRISNLRPYIRSGNYHPWFRVGHIFFIWWPDYFSHVQTGEHRWSGNCMRCVVEICMQNSCETPYNRTRRCSINWHSALQNLCRIGCKTDLNFGVLDKCVSQININQKTLGRYHHTHKLCIINGCLHPSNMFDLDISLHE